MRVFLNAVASAIFSVRYEDLLGGDAGKLWGDILEFIGISRTCGCSCACFKRGLILIQTRKVVPTPHFSWTFLALGRVGTDVALLSSDWRRQIVKGHTEIVVNYGEVRIVQN